MDSKNVIIRIKTIESEIQGLVHLDSDEMINAIEKDILGKLLEVKLENRLNLFGEVSIEYETYKQE